MRWLVAWWRKRQRAIDIQILWPACKENALDLEQARCAFMAHAAIDEAWSNLEPRDIASIIAGLS